MGQQVLQEGLETGPDPLHPQRRLLEGDVVQEV
jgi:hypothetical protein